MNKDFTLCTNHNFIIHSLRQIKHLLKTNNYKDDIIFEIIDECIKDVKIAKKQGEKMEKRLKKYRQAIELLGFIRKKNGV